MRTYTLKRKCKNDFVVARKSVLALLMDMLLDEQVHAVALPTLVKWVGVNRTTLIHYLAAMEAYGDIEMQVYKVEDGGFGEARLVTLVALPSPDGIPMPVQLRESEIF